MPSRPTSTPGCTTTTTNDPISATATRAVDRGKPSSASSVKKVKRTVFSSPNSAPQIVDLSFLLHLPKLANAIATGFYLWGISKAYSSRAEQAKNLRNGFVRFLLE